MKLEKQPNFMKAAILGVVGLLLTLIFFRAQFLNGFSLLFGDRYDAVIELSILEHWHNVFRGLESWSAPNYFYPHPETLAYNDGYFFYGIIYSLFRGAGMDPFLSSELVNIVVKNIGFLAFFLVMRRMMGASFFPAVFAAALFTLSNNSFVHAYHAQLLGVGFVPVQALLLFYAFRAYKGDNTYALIMRGSAAGVFYAAWLMTGYYMAWFFAYFVFVFVLVVGWRERKNFSVFLSCLKNRVVPLTIILLILGLAVAPFLMLYLPKSIETAQSQTASWTPAFLDIINVGDDNLLFGNAYHALDSWLRPERIQNADELTTGLPPLLLISFILCAWKFWRDGSPDRRRLMQNFILALLISWFLTLHIIGFTHRRWSLWKFAHMIIPGASGIRTASRYQILLTAPVVALTVKGLMRYTSRFPRTVVFVMAMALILEQINLASPVNLNRITERERLGLLPPPPPSCQVFYASAPREGSGIISTNDKHYSANVDAMLIAEITHIPTINGISSYNPPDWDFDDPTKQDYPARVRAYAETHHLLGLCGLNMQTLQWSL